jgi:hypothetical protein
MPRYGRCLQLQLNLLLLLLLLVLHLQLNIKLLFLLQAVILHNSSNIHPNSSILHKDSSNHHNNNILHSSSSNNNSTHLKVNSILQHRVSLTHHSLMGPNNTNNLPLPKLEVIQVNNMVLHHHISRQLLHQVKIPTLLQPRLLIQVSLPLLLPELLLPIHLLLKPLLHLL